MNAPIRLFSSVLAGTALAACLLVSGPSALAQNGGRRASGRRQHNRRRVNLACRLRWLPRLLSPGPSPRSFLPVLNRGLNHRPRTGHNQAVQAGEPALLR
jgi:hypothetical protein